MIDSIFDHVMILGEGHLGVGAGLLHSAAEHLQHARKQHPRQEWQSLGVHGALSAYVDEMQEVQQAIHKWQMASDDEKQQAWQELISEIKDVQNVGLRIQNKEWE